MIVRRSALVELPDRHLFDLIEAAEHYPQFLPWCSAATIVSRDDSLVSADLSVRWAGLNFQMRTRNPKQRPHFMAIHLERGPFRRFEGEWRLTALGPDACKVAFNLDYEFDSALMTRVVGPVFNRIADTLVDAFVNRAIATPVAAAPAAPAEGPVPARVLPPPETGAPGSSFECAGAAAPQSPGASETDPGAGSR